VITLEVYDGSSWVDKTAKLLGLRHSITSREIERLEFALVNDDVAVGQQVRAKRNGNIFFEGNVYERRKRHDAKYASVEATAYSFLILYDRHVVYRDYQTGTTAGAIIRDLASLESGVDVTNVDDGPSLNSPWEIQNQPALEIMKSVARGVNYWLRMKPGKILFFKPKAAGTTSGTIDSAKVLKAEYSEDRWKLKNRVIYVGAGGQVLADVSEGAGDLPVVVHDPFLTDESEALRRANIRLALNKEYGKQLRVEMHQTDFEELGVDLGDTITVNLPSLGLSNVNMYLVEVEYDPRELIYRLTLGGRLELFEEYFEEAVGGDVAARFGQAVRVPEILSTIYTSLDVVSAAMRLQASARTIRLVNRPPLILENAQNVILDEDGYARLISGAISGTFEFSCLPKSELFSRWLRAMYDYDPGDGSVSVDLLRGDNSSIESNIPPDYEFVYLPESRGWWTETGLAEWDVVGGTLAETQNAIIGFTAIKATKTGASMKIIYPKTRDAKWNLSKQKYMVIYLYSQENDSALKIRLKKDEENYYEGSLNHVGGLWKKYTVLMSSLNAVGSPSLSQINYLEIETTVPFLCIDSDYVFIPAVREELKLKFTLSRPSASAASPRVKLAKFVWREGR